MRTKDASWGWFVVLIVAGLAVIITALAASGGDLAGEITVRGGSAPAYLILTIGIAMALGGIAGSLWRRS